MKKLPLLAATLMSTFMLAACGNQASQHKSTQSHTSSSKVEKAKRKTSHKTKQAKKASTSSSSSSAAVDSNSSSSASNSSTSSQQHSNIQLGLGDVAIWTDANGVTHHVDSDGMDRQTVPGSSQIHYADWSGPLPVNATVQHNGN